MKKFIYLFLVQIWTQISINTANIQISRINEDETILSRNPRYDRSFKDHIIVEETSLGKRDTERLLEHHKQAELNARRERDREKHRPTQRLVNRKQNIDLVDKEQERSRIRDREEEIQRELKKALIRKDEILRDKPEQEVGRLINKGVKRIENDRSFVDIEAQETERRRQLLMKRRIENQEKNTYLYNNNADPPIIIVESRHPSEYNHDVDWNRVKGPRPSDKRGGNLETNGNHGNHGNIRGPIRGKDTVDPVALAKIASLITLRNQAAKNIAIKQGIAAAKLKKGAVASAILKAQVANAIRKKVIIDGAQKTGILKGVKNVGLRKAKNNLADQIKTRLQSAVIGSSKTAIKQQAVADKVIAASHIVDPHQHHLHHHIAEYKHHLNKARQELLRRLILLK